MSSEQRRQPVDERATIGEYCRQVESRLTQENGGHLVRIVGPAFDIVRQWALDGVPLSVVFQGIAQKAERHRAGRATHPLRIEFCEADVRALFDQWRRAVGVVAASTQEGGPSPDVDQARAEPAGPPSLSKHLDRAIARLTVVAGRLDLPESLRALAAGQLVEVSALREQARTARGQARQALSSRLAPLQRAVASAARDAASPALLADLERQAEQDLAVYRHRLDGVAWRRAVEVTVDRLLRERFGLPTFQW